MTVLIVVLDQIISQLLDHGGALARLDVLVVHTDDDGLVGLDTSTSGSTLLSIDRAVVSANTHVLLAGDEDTAGEDSGGIVELGSELGTLTSGEVEASGDSPRVAVVAADDGLQVRLPY